jgi:hypothetical protein
MGKHWIFFEIFESEAQSSPLSGTVFLFFFGQKLIILQPLKQTPLFGPFSGSFSGTAKRGRHKLSPNLTHIISKKLPSFWHIRRLVVVVKRPPIFFGPPCNMYAWNATIASHYIRYNRNSEELCAPVSIVPCSDEACLFSIWLVELLLHLCLRIFLRHKWHDSCQELFRHIFLETTGISKDCELFGRLSPFAVTLIAVFRDLLLMEASTCAKFWLIVVRMSKRNRNWSSFVILLKWIINEDDNNGSVSSSWELFLPLDLLRTHSVIQYQQ